MRKRRNSISAILVLFILCSLSYSQPSDSAGPPKADYQQRSDEQLDINKNALLEGNDETIRVGAAFLILSDPSSPARQVLLDTLKSDKNKPARIAVCKALGRYRTENKEIPNKQDFIEPLISIIISSEDAAEVKQASEGLLIFKYEAISGQIERLAKDSSVPLKTRLNAIYALQLQPDMRATIQLMRLVDDPDKQVSAETEKALRSIGVPYGQDSATRKDIIQELEGKGKDKFLQDWLIRQEFNRKTLEDSVKLWKGRFFSALDKLYAQVADDVERGKFLSGFLTDSEPQVRLWALDKVYKWWVGTGPKSGILADIRPALINLIPDSDKDVRLKTAQLLSLIGEGDWIVPLTEQYKKEDDAEVKTSLFDALGWAAYYGSLPNAAVKVSPELKRQILKWAEEYIADNDAKKSQKGVDVIKKLLEQEGLTPGEAEHYFAVLGDKYNQSQSDEVLSSQLLDAMAKLCANSVYKDKAAGVFRPLFEQGIKNQADNIRQAAVEGLINIDKASALKMLRIDFINDKNPVIRQKIIELADNIGTKDDLNWLAEKIGSNSESKTAWQAMLKIFKRSEAAVIYEWIGRLEAKNTDGKLTGEQILLLLETAEAKITAEKNPKMLRDVQLRLSKIYRASGDYEKAAKYIGILLQGETTTAQKEARMAELLDVYLRWPNLELAAQLLSNRLLQEDLDENNPLVISIENCLVGLPAGADPNNILESLRKIQTTGRPKWTTQLQKWSQQFAAASDPNQPK
jgi:HEAT repeat protein